MSKEQTAIRKTLFKHLKEQEVSFDAWYIDDNDSAFDAIELAMVDYASQQQAKHKEELKEAVLGTYYQALDDTNFNDLITHEECREMALKHYKANHETKQLDCQCVQWCTGQDELKEGYKCANKFYTK